MKVRLLLGLLCGLAGLVAVTAIAVASGGPPRHGHHRAAPAMPKMSPAAVQRLRRRAADRRAWLKSSAAKKARRRSRTQYRGASAPAALRIASDNFRSVIAEPVYDGLRLHDGERVDHYLGNNVALIDEPGTKRRTVARSTLPLVTASPSGGKVPVDLGLERRGGRLQPRAALAQVSFSDDAGGGFSLGDAGVTVRPESADGVSAAVVNDRLFFAGVATDTDLVEMPVPGGVETYDVLRSSASPENLGYSLDLPAGASLRLVPGENGLPSGAQVVRDGKLLVDIPAARAHDADGVQVPVAYRLDGNRLVLHVPHRARSFRYPLLVDPTLVSGPYYIRNGTETGNGWAGWTWIRANINYNFFIGGASYSKYGTRYGMTIQAGPGQIDAGHYGNWYWMSPANTYIYRADWRYVTYQWLYQVVNEGVISSGAVWEQGTPSSGSPRQITGDVDNDYHYFCFDSPECTSVPAGAAAGQRDGNSMIFGLQNVYVTATFPPVYATMQGADIYSNELHPPVVDSFDGGVSSAWTDAPNLTATYTAHDVGFGLWKYTIVVPGTSNQVSYSTNPECSGQLNSVCPLNPGSQQMSYPTSSLPQGTSTLDFYATDAVNNDSAHRQWPIRIDRTPPTLTTSGSLKDAAGDYTPPNATLNVSATDPYSGVKSIEILVDGQRKDFYAPNTSCDGCPLSRSWSWHSSDYAPGDHQIKVIATDFIGTATHQTIDQWTVTTDDAEPDVGVSGTLWDADQSTVSEPSYDLAIDAYDGDVGDEETGVKSIEIRVDGTTATFDSQTCAAGNCTMAKSWAFATAQYSEGDHTIEIYVTDQAGNVDIEEVDVTVKHISTMSSQSVDTGSVASRRLDGAAAGDHAGQAVAGVGDINGDGYDDYAIGAPNAAPAIASAAGLPPVARPSAGKVYVTFGKAPSSLPFDLASMTASDGYTISGATPLDRCGTAVTSAGDVNGDGIDDLLVGCPATDGSTSAPPAQGRVYVIFGSATPSDVDLLQLGQRGFVINGPQVPGGAFAPGARPFGTSLAGPRAGSYGSAADVNGDELDDVVIGSSTDSNNSRSGSGSTYVVYGKADTAPVSTTNLGTMGFRIDGAAAGNASGFAAAAVGDVSGDDYADVVVTAPGANPAGRTSAGMAYVVLGNNGGANVDLANLGAGGFPVYGASGDMLGSSAAAIGDVDGDSLNDFAIGGHGGFVVYGREVTDAVDFASPDLNFALRPPSGGGYDSAVVGGGGDLNNDGMPDVLVSFPAAQSAAGAVYAILSQDGKNPNTAAIDLASLPGQLGSRFLGAVAGDSAGASVDGIDAGAIDANGDPQPAILIGAPNRATARGAGAGGAYMVPANSMSANTTASGAGVQQPRSCWHHPYKYPFNDPSYDFPRKCRETDKKNTDQTPITPAGGYGGHTRSGRDKGGILRKTFAKGKRLTGKVPIYDSDVNLLGYLEQQSRHKHFKYYDPSGKVVPTTQKGSHLSLLLETTPCMTTGHTPGNWAMFSMQGGGSELSGLRFLIGRGDLPLHAFSASRTNDDVINSGWVPCHKPPGYKKLTSVSHPYSFPGFVITTTQPPDYSNDDRYEGAGKAKSCESRRPSVSRFDASCGAAYWHYQIPRTPITNFPNTVLVSSSTTGVGSGGLGRGVLEVGTGSVATTQKDMIRYVDVNVPCKHRPVAHWYLLRRLGIWGWFVGREQQGTGTIRNTGSCA